MLNDYLWVLAEFLHLPEDRDLLKPTEKNCVYMQLDVFVSLPCCQLEATARSYSKEERRRSNRGHRTPKRGQDGNKPRQCGRHRIQRTIWAFFSTKLTSYYMCIIAAKLNLKLLCRLKDLWIRSNAEFVCDELIVMIRVAGDIQSSSRRNSGGRRLVLIFPWKRSCKGTWKWSTCQPRSQCFSIPFLQSFWV